MILQSLAGLPAFLVYFCTAIVAVVAYLFIYTRVTPHDEFQLIRDNDPAAAIAKEHGNVLKVLARALRRKEGADGRRVVDFSGKGGLMKRARKAG